MYIGEGRVHTYTQLSGPVWLVILSQVVMSVLYTLADNTQVCPLPFLSPSVVPSNVEWYMAKFNICI